MKTPWWKYYPILFSFKWREYHIEIRKAFLLEIQYFPSKQADYYNKLCFGCFQIHWPPVFNGGKEKI